VFIWRNGYKKVEGNAFASTCCARRSLTIRARYCNDGRLHDVLALLWLLYNVFRMHSVYGLMLPDDGVL
jgi:hypothetical protein